ncbi:MAG TPA: LPS export ABC transporter ATP-binding protein [Gemmatimonadales bacterium]|nr:LPS export ABC transporter ATP-binding protein [Gemmatimonadales bacterium]
MIDEILNSRDPSVPLAAVALLITAEEDGTGYFGPLAVAYRDAYLHARAATAGETGEIGTLSVDDARHNLSASVLPRLVLLGAVTMPKGELHGDTAITFVPALWQEITADPSGVAARLRQSAERALKSAESPSGPHQAALGGSKLEASNLMKSYKGRHVVNDVSLAVQQGEIVGLLGPNGAGKTTSFYMITGLIRPDSGVIRFDGNDITREPMYKRARSGIGYLAQEPSVFRKLTVEENVLAILETMNLEAAERATRLEALLDDLAIKHLRRQRAFSLSGGERRRLEITRALVTQPKFMLLDEPFAGVDPIAVHDIQTIVAGLRHRGIGVLITDHNVEQTLDIVDRAYIMFEGKVQVAGTVRDLVFDDRVADLYLGPTLTARLRARLGEAA